MLTKLKGEVDLLGRHLQVLTAVVEHEPIGIMKLSLLLDLPYHRIRYSLRILEHLGYIRASPSGAVATPKAQGLLGKVDRELDELVRQIQALKRARQ
jgi:predicted transcriptional regulator